LDLYDLLGVRRNATVAEIRRAFQKHARRLHPDLNPGDPVAAERFRALSQAFEVLSSPQRRAEYDRGESQAPMASRVPIVGFEGFDFSSEATLAGVGFREIFGGVLRRQPASAADAPRGEDLEQSTLVTFDETLRGARRRVHLVRQEHCSACRGAGQVAFGPVSCPSCRGTGQVRANRGHMIFSRSCEDCGGVGTISRRPCGRCGSEGRVMASEWLDVEIPAGVSDGARVRVPGCGNAGQRGGPPGDFVLVVRVEAHPSFRREGDDLFCEVPVTITEAALGAHVEVQTPDGPVTIEIPAGTQTGQRFRLRKRGVPQLGGKGRGDLFAEARVLVPTVRAAQPARSAQGRAYGPRREGLRVARGRRPRGDVPVDRRPPPGSGKYYMISVVAKSYGIHPQTLRLYEREGLLKPSRTEGNTRLYSEDDLRQLEVILNLTRDLGVNLAGVEIVLNMRRKMEQMQREMNEFVTYVKEELVRANQEGWQERFQQALVKLPPTQIVRTAADVGGGHPELQGSRAQGKGAADARPSRAESPKASEIVDAPPEKR
jgi:molecular chaperone DnaJ